MSGNELRALRKTLGITQEQLASKAGIKRSMIANMELGRQRVNQRPVGAVAKLLMAEGIESWLWDHRVAEITDMLECLDIEDAYEAHRRKYLL